MRKVEQFYGTEAPSKQAVQVVGLQPGNQSVWVLNTQIHIKNGQCLTPEESPYKWVEAAGLPPVTLQCNIPQATTGSVEGALALSELIKSLEVVHQQNFAATLMVLGGQLLCTHYQKIYSICGQVPVTLIYGEVSLGKTRAAEAAHSLLGINKKFKVNKITDKQASRLAALSTLGLIIDDPTTATEFNEKVLTYFNKGLVTSCSGTYEPRCTFMATLNMECMREFAEMPKR